MVDVPDKAQTIVGSITMAITEAKLLSHKWEVSLHSGYIGVCHAMSVKVIVVGLVCCTC